MAVGIEQKREIPHHVGEQILAAALGQAQHGEVRIPVIDFAKSSPRHNVGVWERQRRGVTRGYRRFARQLIPQLVDVGGDGDLFGRRGHGGRLVGKIEMGGNELPERFRSARSRVVILTQDLAWRGLGNRVDECLAIVVEGL